MKRARAILFGVAMLFGAWFVGSTSSCTDTPTRPTDPPVDLIAFGLSAQSPTESAAGSTIVRPGEPFLATGSFWSAEDLTGHVLARVITLDRNRRPITNDSGTGDLQRGEVDGFWSYELELNAPRQTGTHILRITYRGEIVDERTFEVEEADR